MTNDIQLYQDKLLPAAAGDIGLADMMVRLGQIYKIPEEDLVPENIGALATVASWSSELGYLPGADIGMIPFNKQVERTSPNGQTVKAWIKVFTPYVTYDRWKTNAAIGAREEGVFLHHEIEELTPEETLKYISTNIAIQKGEGQPHPNDRGARCRLIKVLPSGREFTGAWHYGFWRQNASYSQYKKEWTPDTVPTQRTPQSARP